MYTYILYVYIKYMCIGKFMCQMVESATGKKEAEKDNRTKGGPPLFRIVRERLLPSNRKTFE